MSTVNKIAVAWLLLATGYFVLPGEVVADPGLASAIDYWLFLGATIAGAVLCQSAVNHRKVWQAVLSGGMAVGFAILLFTLHVHYPDCPTNRGPAPETGSPTRP
jgi:hypothetical protein